MHWTVAVGRTGVVYLGSVIEYRKCTVLYVVYVLDCANSIPKISSLRQRLGFPIKWRRNECRERGTNGGVA